MAKQKHDPGAIKRRKNEILNPQKLSRETKVARRIADHSRDYVTAIDIDAANGHAYAMSRDDLNRTVVKYPLGFKANEIKSKPKPPPKVFTYGRRNDGR